jgi:hypothetical protein
VPAMPPERLEQIAAQQREVFARIFPGLFDAPVAPASPQQQAQRDESAFFEGQGGGMAPQLAPQAPAQAPVAQPQPPQQPVAQPPQPQQGFTPSPMHQLGQHYNSLPPDYNSLLATSGEIKTERDLIQQSSAAIQQLSPEDLAVVHANVASLPNSAQYGRLKEALLPLIQAEIQKRKANPPMQPGDVNLALKFGNAVPVSTPEGRQQVPIGGTYVAPDGTVRRRAN